MNPGEKWPPEEGSQEEDEPEETEEGDAHDLPAEFIDLVAGSSLVPAICSYLRNDSGMIIIDLDKFYAFKKILRVFIFITYSEYL